MDFPDLGSNQNQENAFQNVNDAQNNENNDMNDMNFDMGNMNMGQTSNNNDGIQIESMQPGQSSNNDGGFNVMQNSNDGNFFQSAETNQTQQAPSMNYDGFGGDMGQNQIVDEEEENRIKARRDEENERRSKVVTLMNDEIRIKQENRDKAREFLDNYNE